MKNEPKDGKDVCQAATMLIAAMAKKGLSQAELERRLGVSDGVVSRWLSGERTPSLRHALALEKMFKIPARLWLRVLSGQTGTDG